MPHHKPASPLKPAKVRTLKVHDKIYFRGPGPYNRRPVTYSQIKLIGKWLTDSGFHPGQYVRVTTEPNKLTITPHPPTQP